MPIWQVSLLAGTDAGDLTTRQQANAVLVALVHMLLPKEIIGNDPLDEADLDALTEVMKHFSSCCT